MWSKIGNKKTEKIYVCKTEMKGPNVEFLVLLTIIISVFDDQIFGYKQLALNTKISDPTRLADVVKSIKASS